MVLRAVHLQGKTTVQSAPVSLPDKNDYGPRGFFKKKNSNTPDLQPLGEQAAVFAAFPANAAPKTPEPR